MNNYKSFAELKEELGSNYDFKLYEMGISALKEVEKLQQENNKLNGSIQTYDILLKANAEENKQLQEELKYTIGIVEHNRIISEKNKEIHQLKKQIKEYQKALDETMSEKIDIENNWNKLREWIVYNKHNENTEQHYLVVDYGTLLGKMQELERGSDSNV